MNTDVTWLILSLWEKYKDNMDLYEELKRIEEYVARSFPQFGVNKRREIIRLAFEILKRDKNKSLDFIPANFKNYEKLKDHLLKIRYPYSYGKIDKKNFYLPKIDIKKSDTFVYKKEEIYPEKIYYEKDTKNSELFFRFKNIFPESEFVEIDFLKNFKNDFSISGYNKRTKNFFLVKEKQDFVKSCPCTKGCYSCNYFVFNLSFGCPYECSYCFLQGYQNISGLIFQSNIEDFFKEFERKFSNLPKHIRIGTGEFSDSLALDHITDFSTKFVEYFSKKEKVYFELKTKSNNISNLLKIKPSKNIVISFSLNPQPIVEKNEFYTASFKERLNAMSELSKYGYSVAFHLDPIIKVKNWEKLYSEMIEEIFSKVSPEEIKWVSCGTFRFKRETKKVIETRFIDNEILDEEMILDFDGKLRYPFEIRLDIYKKIINFLTLQGLNKKKIYLCMENFPMWKNLGLDFRFSWEIY